MGRRRWRRALVLLIVAVVAAGCTYNYRTLLPANIGSTPSTIGAAKLPLHVAVLADPAATVDIYNHGSIQMNPALADALMAALAVHVDRVSRVSDRAQAQDADLVAIPRFDLGPWQLIVDFVTPDSARVVAQLQYSGPRETKALREQEKVTDANALLAALTLCLSCPVTLAMETEGRLKAYATDIASSLPTLVKGVSDQVSTDPRLTAFAPSRSRTVAQPAAGRSVERGAGSTPARPAPVAARRPGPGVFDLESALDFNVLDAVVFDRRSGRLTLIGHRDRRYGTAKIPYLQHLAELLERPEPRFTLNWTPESEAQVSRLFRRMDSPDEVRRVAAQWGYWIDERGQVTPMGRHFMPIFGVTPTNDRYEIVASMLRATGNARAADITAAFGRAKRAENTPAFQSALQNVVAAVGALDDLNRLKGQVQRREISEWDGQMGFGRAVTSRMDSAFNLNQQPVQRTFEQVMQSRRDLGDAFTAAFAELDRQLRTILGTAMQTLLARHDQITVPPDVIQATVGVRPEVVPEYIGVDSHSQVARVLFEADYIGKQIPNRPDLEKKIPRYMTDFSYERANPSEAGRFRPTVTQHLWISVDAVDLAESADGGMLETRSARMRFNIRDKVDGRSVPGSASGYETLLTSIYDDLAVEFPALHELREVVKVGAVVDWLRARKPDLKLPVAGRTAWNGPARVAGLVYMTWTPNPRPGQVTATMMAMGGDDARRRNVSVSRSAANLGSLAEAPGTDPAEIARVVPLTAFPKPLGWVRSGSRDGAAVTAITLFPDPDEGGATVSRKSGDGGTVVWRLDDLDGFEKKVRADLAAAGSDLRQLATQRALLAEALHEKGDDKAAIRELNEAIKLAPDLPVIQLLLARAMAESGDLAGAEQALVKYLALEPGNAAAAGLLRELQDRQKGVGNVGAGGSVRLGPAFQQAKAIQLDTLGAGPTKEAATAATGQGFDRGQASAPPVPGFTLRGLPRPLPPAVEKNPRMIELRQQDAALEQKQQQVEQELEAIRLKKARREGDAKELEVAEKKLKDERAEIVTKRDDLKTKMVDLGVQLEEAPDAAKPAATPASAEAAGAPPPADPAR